MRRQPPLDGLRALAACGVLAYHVYNTTVPHIGREPWPLRTGLVLNSVGAMGVNCFFVLSAFLLTRPFLEWMLTDARRPVLGRYAATRLLRIFPAWWAVLAVMATLYAPGVLHQYTQLALFGTLTQNYAGLGHHIVPHGWTLCVEISFYAVLPPVAIAAAGPLRRLRRSHRPMALAAGLVAITVLAWAYELGYLPGLPTHGPAALSLPMFLDRFTVGALAALFIVSGRTPAPRPCFGAAVLLTVLAFAAAPGMRFQITTLAFGLSVLGLASSRASLPKRLAGARVPAHLGLISYGIYLWHLPLKYFAERLGWLDRGHGLQTLPATVLLFAATVAMAELSWRLIEQPALGLVRRRPSPPLLIAPARRPRHAR